MPERRSQTTPWVKPPVVLADKVDALLHLLEIIRQTPVPKVVYHYTSPAGVLGIVNSGAIWATDIRYLNDAHEFDYAHELAESNLTLWRQGTAVEAEQNLFSNCLTGLGIAASGVPVYASSFSESRDLLSQWRAYSPPSGGFTLGFVGERLQDASDCLLLPCIYDPQQQLSLLGELVNFLLGRSRGRAEGQRSNEWVDYGLEFLNGFLLLAGIFKHESFAEEKEWRLVKWRSRLDTSSLSFRDGRVGIIPYLELPLRGVGTAIHIDGAVVGPGPHTELSRQALLSLLLARKVEHGDVAVSTTPYRPW